MALNQIDDMVKRGAYAPEVMAYLVLARGTGRNKRSTWKQAACAKYTEMTYYGAGKAIEWLEAEGFIQNGGNKSKPVWYFTATPEDEELALANSLIEGVGKGKNHPPLKLIDELPIGAHGGLNAARLDTLMVMLHLYRHQLLADYGGINPSSGIYRKWVTAENQWGDEVTDIEGTNAALYEIDGGSDMVFMKFADEALFYVEDAEERAERFWDAFHNLKRLGWLYETTQVWTADPSADRRAEPCYTLYVHNRHARETDPFLMRDIHRLAVRAGAMDACAEFFRQEGDINSGRFRFIATKKKGGYPIGIYRMKFRPHTRDTGKGMSAEKQRVAAWSKSLEALC